MVEVLDRGPGVADDVRPSLFLPFAARSGDGHSGLGLATAAAAVRAHGGAISYSDRPGGGADFAFTVPA
jgi:signal transduction histidine kinase